MQPGLLITLQLPKAVLITCTVKTGGKIKITIKKNKTKQQTKKTQTKANNNNNKTQNSDG